MARANVYRVRNPRARHVPEVSLKSPTMMIISIILNDFYSGSSPGPYDIALLKLEVPLIFNRYVRPLRLPKGDSVPTGTSILTGWGSMSKTRNYRSPRHLQKVQLPLISLEECGKFLIDLFGESSPLHDTNVCTGSSSKVPRAACRVSYVWFFCKILEYHAVPI